MGTVPWIRSLAGNENSRFVLRKSFAFEANIHVRNRILFILQHIKTGEFRICLKELYANQHDPVNVTYAVLAGGLEGEKNLLPLQLQ